MLLLFQEEGFKGDSVNSAIWSDRCIARLVARDTFRHKRRGVWLALERFDFVHAKPVAG